MVGAAVTAAATATKLVAEERAIRQTSLRDTVYVRTYVESGWGETTSTDISQVFHCVIEQRNVRTYVRVLLPVVYGTISDTPFRHPCFTHSLHEQSTYYCSVLLPSPPPPTQWGRTQSEREKHGQLDTLGRRRRRRMRSKRWMNKNEEKGRKQGRKRAPNQEKKGLLRLIA